eukprot:scpid47201/ scgid25438/ 
MKCALPSWRVCCQAISTVFWAVLAWLDWLCNRRFKRFFLLSLVAGVTMFVGTFVVEDVLEEKGRDTVITESIVPYWLLLCALVIGSCWSFYTLTHYMEASLENLSSSLSPVAWFLMVWFVASASHTFPFSCYLALMRTLAWIAIVAAINLNLSDEAWQHIPYAKWSQLKPLDKLSAGTSVFIFLLWAGGIDMCNVSSASKLSSNANSDPAGHCLSLMFASIALTLLFIYIQCSHWQDEGDTVTPVPLVPAGHFLLNALANTVLSMMWTWTASSQYVDGFRVQGLLATFIIVCQVLKSLQTFLGDFQVTLPDLHDVHTAFENLRSFRSWTCDRNSIKDMAGRRWSELKDWWERRRKCTAYMFMVWTGSVYMFNVTLSNAGSYGITCWSSAHHGYSWTCISGNALLGLSMMSSQAIAVCPAVLAIGDNWDVPHDVLETWKYWPKVFACLSLLHAYWIIVLPLATYPGCQAPSPSTKMILNGGNASNVSSSLATNASGVAKSLPWCVTNTIVTVILPMLIIGPILFRHLHLFYKHAKTQRKLT